jgi:uncharacterized membrane protein
MKRNIVLTLTSLLSILLLSFHLTQDSLNKRPGTWDSGPGNLVVIVILLVFLCGVVLLAERRSGGIITLLGSLFAAGMPVIHLMRPRLGQVDNYGAAFFFLWTLIALGVTGMFSAILAARELWSFKRAR